MMELTLELEETLWEQAQLLCMDENLTLEQAVTRFLLESIQCGRFLLGAESKREDFEIVVPDHPDGEYLKGPLGTPCPQCGSWKVEWSPEKDNNTCQVCGWSDK